MAEDPSVRLRRLADELGYSQSMLVRVVKEPMIGFHLNCCVYEVHLGKKFETVMYKKMSAIEHDEEIPLPNAFKVFSEEFLRIAKGLQIKSKDYLNDVAKKRFEKDAVLILDKLIDDSVTQLMLCNKKEENLTPQLIPEVLNLAKKSFSELINNHKEDQWQSYLNKTEKILKQKLQCQAEEWTVASQEIKTAIKENHFAPIFEAQAEAGCSALRDSIEKRNFNSIIVTLPDSGYHCEPVVGHCAAAEELRMRELNANIEKSEAEAEQSRAEADRQRKRVDNLEAKELVNDNKNLLHLQIKSEEE